MNKFCGGFPMYIEKAFGNKIATMDKHTYIDFALGDTGAMAGILITFIFYVLSIKTIEFKFIIFYGLF